MSWGNGSCTRACSPGDQQTRDFGPWDARRSRAMMRANAWGHDELTHWGQMRNMYINNLDQHDSDNGLPPFIVKLLPGTVFGHISFMKTSWKWAYQALSILGLMQGLFSSPHPVERAPDVWCISRHKVSTWRDNNTIIIFPLSLGYRCTWGVYIYLHVQSYGDKTSWQTLDWPDLIYRNALVHVHYCRRLWPSTNRASSTHRRSATFVPSMCHVSNYLTTFESR